jgi:fucose 4-O-acetylase-like acetyltransferase
LYRRHVARFGRPAMLVALAAAALALVSAPLDVKIADYGTPVLSIVAALGLCHLVFVVAQHLPASRIVAAIGQASLVIMYLHLTILYALRDRFAAGPIALLGIVLPIAIWALLRRFGVTRTLLLGERTRTLDPGARSAQEAV